MHRLAFYAVVALITFLMGISLAGKLRSTTMSYTFAGQHPLCKFYHRAGLDTTPSGRLAPLTALAPDRPDPVSEQEIRELYRQYALAQNRRDASFFERVEADEFILTYAAGSTWTRDQAVAAMKAWTDGTTYSNEVLEARFYGNTAIVKGQMTATRSGGDNYQWKWLDVLVKRKGNWQILSTTQVNY